MTIHDKARDLSNMLKESEEYKSYKTTREKAFANETTAGLIKQYHKERIAAQAAMVAGNEDKDTMERLQKIGELLQLNVDASDFLIAEYRLNVIISDIYKILAEAIDVDLSMLEN